MPMRMNILFQFETAPDDAQAARPHVGAWSEQIWFANDVDFTARANHALLEKRAALLPTEVQIIGYRKERFALVGNRMMPQGTQVFNDVIGGDVNAFIDAPQVSLGFVGSVNNATNRNTFYLRGLPDGYCVKGEYFPTPAYTGFVQAWKQKMIALGAGFVGRNNSNAVARVNLVAGNAVTLSADPGAGIGDYLRFFHVKSDLGLPLKGAYLITNKVGNVFTLQGLANRDLTKPNGLCRKDELALFQYSGIEITRVGVRKVGRPTQLYRGRRAKAH